MKQKRHKAILDIIEQNEVYNQDSLLTLLKLEGFDVTQATVSRDIRVLDLVKVQSDSGKHRYSKHQDYAVKKNAVKFKSVFVEAVISVDYALNTVVIKCHVGMANAACAALDAMDVGDVVGTLAGDDTIFVLVRSEKAAMEYAQKIIELI